VRIPNTVAVIGLVALLGGRSLINSHAEAHSGSSGSNPTISVWFSPHGGCTEAVVDAVDHAKSTVLVQAYSFTSAPIAKALKEAHDRGVDVRVILDKSQRTERYSGLTYLQHAGIPTWIDAAHAIAHNKVMVIDGETVVTGSFNFSKSAEASNAENLLVIRDAALAKAYAANWAEHLSHSETP
jgi:phosphatidylserine/phosphatidylglycerophosphate/cardiolipin synthase-like enzyme